MQLLCLSLVVMRCQPLRRALCNRREKDHNVLKVKVFLWFFYFEFSFYFVYLILSTDCFNWLFIKFVKSVLFMLICFSSFCSSSFQSFLNGKVSLR
ncbi:hypothetical protein FXF08_00780 [Vibrio cholerae]|nr:hypothetical protein FXF08_00780 [Vibrio cholerae]